MDTEAPIVYGTADDANHDVKRPCPECPFSRHCQPGIGGAHPFRYVGQAVGPFLLPCHMAGGFDASGQAKCMPDTAQCGGAATYRTHIGVSDKMPPAFHRLPENKTDVFATPAELVAHHLQIPVAEAETLLQVYPPEQLCQEELAIVRAKVAAKALGVPVPGQAKIMLTPKKDKS